MGYSEQLLAEYLSHRPPLTRKDDFDAFWEEGLEDSRRRPLHLTVERVDTPNRHVNTFRVTYDGVDETRINAWFMAPAFLPQKNLPVMVHFNDPSPYIHNHMLLMGVCVFAPGTRGQSDCTPDRKTYGTNTLRSPIAYGITNKNDYYLRNVYLDNIRAIDALQQLPETDGSRIMLEGGSFGGGVTLAVAALDDRPFAAFPNVPAFSEFEGFVKNGTGAAGQTLREYLTWFPERAEAVLDTLSYFDLMNMADRINCPVLAAVGGADQNAPPIHFFAAYNRMNCEKDVKVYPFHGHTVLETHRPVKMAYIQKLLGVEMK
jgi:cephalosporin-C deacetylase